MDVRRTHHPEADIVVAVVRIVVVAVVRARGLLIVVPRTAAHGARLVSGCPTGFPGDHQSNRH